MNRVDAPAGSESDVGSASTSGWSDYDYAVVRVVPRVHCGTFINVGVVLHARVEGLLVARFEHDRQRLASRCSGVDPDTILRFIAALEAIVAGGPDGGAIGMLAPSERFHWLTAPRSAVLQTSEVHPGRSHDIRSELDRLYDEQVR